MFSLPKRRQDSFSQRNLWVRKSFKNPKTKDRVDASLHSTLSLLKICACTLVTVHSVTSNHTVALADAGVEHPGDALTVQAKIFVFIAYLH